MADVLLICPEPLGHHHPAGIGIRFLEFARALTNASHQVTLLTPDGAVIPDCGSGRISAETMSQPADVVVLQGHVGNDFFSLGRDVPTVVDLYDPYIVENLHYASSRGGEVFEHDHATLMRSIAAGDFFLCASEAQRLFYLGILLAARRINPYRFLEDRTFSSVLSIVPFGVPPPRALPAKRSTDAQILFGGIYDWYDPILAIDAALMAKQRVPELTLTFTRHPNAAHTPQHAFAEAERYVSMRGCDDVIRFESWFPYEQRAEHYDRFTAALLTFRPSIETDLAMRTRIFDYLWGGLPIVTSSAPGTDRLLETHGAGIVVRDHHPEHYADALVRFTEQRVHDAAVTGAQRWAAAHQWNQLIEPLLEFCRNPRTISKAAPLPQLPHRSILRRLVRRFGGVS